MPSAETVEGLLVSFESAESCCRHTGNEKAAGLRTRYIFTVSYRSSIQFNFSSQKKKRHSRPGRLISKVAELVISWCWGYGLSLLGEFQWARYMESMPPHCALPILYEEHQPWPLSTLHLLMQRAFFFSFIFTSSLFSLSLSLPRAFTTHILHVPVQRALIKANRALHLLQEPRVKAATKPPAWARSRISICKWQRDWFYHKSASRC